MILVKSCRFSNGAAKDDTARRAMAPYMKEFFISTVYC